MTTLKILGIVGSPRKNSNTEVMVREALAGAQEVGHVETDILLLAGKKINPCNSCFACKKVYDYCVHRFKDDMQEYYEKYLSADGVIIGAPVYHLSVPGVLKNAIDRLGQGILSRYRKTGLPWFCKAAGVLTQGVSKFGGQEYTLQFLVSHLIIMNNLVIPPDGINALGVAGSFQDHPTREPGVIAEHDPESVKRSRILGRRVAEVATILHAGVTALKDRLPPEYDRNVLMKHTIFPADVREKRTSGS
jgi:multimeric flavodoxin WrbA